MNRSTMTYIGVLGLLAAVGLVSAVFMIASPGEVRLQKLDQEKVNYMRDLSYSIDNYHRYNEILPATFDEIEQNSAHIYRKNQEMNMFKDVEYNVVDSEKGKYTLCSDFKTSSDDHEYFYYDHDWAHDAGHQCFELKVRE